MRIATSAISLFVLVAACGGGSAQTTATTPPTTTSATPSATSAAPSVASATASAAPAPSASAAVDLPENDPTESDKPIPMPGLLTKATPKSSFPKKTVGDLECWQGTMITGDSQKDYATIVGKCGAPTGLQEYAKPMAGRLHHKHDQRDTYVIKLAGGLCYRYFAVGDGTITDLDILVEKPGGALVADDKTTHPVAIVENDKTWCIDQDVEYQFRIEVDGVGKGGYVFGVWARPK